jgi:uncharacterized membrane protein YbhN (UPF0104 family)
MKRSHWIRVLVSVTLLAVALFVLRSQLRDVEFGEVLARVRGLPPSSIAAAVLLTLLNYAQLTLYDVIGLGYLHRRLPYRKVALASFVATAFGHNIGFSFASSGSVRYRFFSAWGLSTGEVAALVAFGSLTYAAGFACVAGVVLVAIPDGAATLRLVDPALLRGIGAALLLLGGSYLGLSLFGPEGVTHRGRTFELPRPALAVGQIVVGAADWLLMTWVLSLLLPSGAIDYAALLRLVLVAQVAGSLSQVPGGLGVFESLMVTSLTPALPVSTVLGTLVFYRVLYYFLPFAAAIALFSLHELKRRVSVAPPGLAPPPSGSARS